MGSIDGGMGGMGGSIDGGSEAGIIAHAGNGDCIGMPKGRPIATGSILAPWDAPLFIAIAAAVAAAAAAAAVAAAPGSVPGRAAGSDAAVAPGKLLGRPGKAVGVAGGGTSARGGCGAGARGGANAAARATAACAAAATAAAACSCDKEWPGGGGRTRVGFDDDDEAGAPAAVAFERLPAAWPGNCGSGMETAFIGGGGLPAVAGAGAPMNANPAGRVADPGTQVMFGRDGATWTFGRSCCCSAVCCMSIC